MTPEDRRAWLSYHRDNRERELRSAASYKVINDMLALYGCEPADDVITALVRVLEVLDMIEAVTLIKQKLREKRLMKAPTNLTLKHLRDALTLRMAMAGKHKRAVVLACLRALVKHKQELRLFFAEDFDNDKRMDQIPLAYFNDVTRESLLRTTNFGLVKLNYLLDALHSLGVGVEDVRRPGHEPLEGCDGPSRVCK